MRFSFNFSLLAVACAYADAGMGVYRPLKIDFEQLIHPTEDGFPSSQFEESLTHVGLISVTGIPGDRKEETLSWLHACALDSGATKEHKFSDNTLRRTMATQTIPGPGGTQVIDHKTTTSVACESFSKMSSEFREMTAAATQAFADRLTDIVGYSGRPLLEVEGGSYQFDTIAEVVESGEHLEHFHSYQKPASSLKGRNTIDMHVDQGLFIAFTPGSIVREEDAKIDRLSDGFYIEMEDGSQSMVEFDNTDDLVFMLGDGIHQLLNSHHDKNLRATPHALSMSDHAEDEARVWYGRMVLPPASAIHPGHGKTFESLRQEMIDNSLSGEEEIGLGCSNDMTARQLEAPSCAEGTTLCWHRCMNHTEYEVSDDSCADLGLTVQCVNPRGQLSLDRHGDFYPACADLATIPTYTDYPTVPGYPRSNGTECDADHFKEFAMAGEYVHSHNLGDHAFLLWTINGDAVNAKLAFDGLFGYLSIGFAGFNTSKNGMHAGEVLMAVPGLDYSPVTGFNLSQGNFVNTYFIDETQASFRHWSVPLLVSASATADITATARNVGPSVETDPCFTALYFSADNINGKKFNTTGTDDLIWAGNPKDYFAGHHPRPMRSRFVVNWVTGEIVEDLGIPPWAVEETEEEVEEEVEEETSGGATLTLFTSFIASIAFFALEL